MLNPEIRALLEKMEGGKVRDDAGVPVCVCQLLRDAILQLDDCHKHDHGKTERKESKTKE